MPKSKVERRFFVLKVGKEIKGLIRVTKTSRDYRLEFLNKNGHWELDRDLAGYVFRGEPGAYEVSAVKAEVIIKRWRKQEERKRHGQKAREND